ncbi:MAG: hypothetical protein ACI815_002623 [Psychroserpens sp.]|jgi:hypothetical protein
MLFKLQRNNLQGDLFLLPMVTNRIEIYYTSKSISCPTSSLNRFLNIYTKK